MYKALGRQVLPLLTPLDLAAVFVVVFNKSCFIFKTAQATNHVRVLRGGHTNASPPVFTFADRGLLYGTFVLEPQPWSRPWAWLAAPLAI